MNWIWVSFFSVVILISVLFTAGFEFLDLEQPPSTAQALPAATR